MNALAANTSPEPPGEVLSSVKELCERIRSEVRKAVVGKTELVDEILTGLLSRGHLLLEGVPGVAKTTIAKSFAKSLGCQFKRIQFTPDLLPSDIIGTYIYNMKTNDFELHRGPIMANIVLVDEINRTPPKTQSALLEAMQERQITLEGETLKLPEPFMVVGTQNPIEFEGVFPLPEAQIDRFQMKLQVTYPTPEEEREILLGARSDPAQLVGQVSSPEEIVRIQGLMTGVHVAPEIANYVVRLVTFTREHPDVLLGGSPRASLAILEAGRARALIQGRAYVLPDDVKALAAPCLNHRILLKPEAALADGSSLKIIDQALRKVPVQT